VSFREIEEDRGKYGKSWRHTVTDSPFTFRGVEFPYETHHEGASMWPNTEYNGHTGPPSRKTWVCIGCGNKVASASEDGDGWSIKREWEEAAKAFVYHNDNCYALKALRGNK
jgi:hypothetical protein